MDSGSDSVEVLMITKLAFCTLLIAIFEAFFAVGRTVRHSYLMRLLDPVFL